MGKFPPGRYGRQRLEFQPAPFRAPIRSFAALVFPWCGDKVLLCKVEDRGWCIPSGRVEAGEESIEAAKREAYEECGATLDNVQYLGCYRITDRDEVRFADMFTSTVAAIHDLPEEFESEERRFVTLEEVPEIYHQWNELMAMLFEHSYHVVRRLEDAIGCPLDKPELLEEV